VSTDDFTKINFPQNVTHEYKASLSSILGYVKLINTLPESNADLKKYLSAIDTSSRSLITLTNNLEAQAQLVKGTFSLQSTGSSLEGIFQSVCDVANQLASQKNLEFNGKITKRCANFANFDYSQLKLVLLNLIENAFKFTDDDDGLIEFVVDQKEDELIFSVSDSGMGMTKSEVDNFMQCFSGTLQNCEKFGLGLNVCHQLVNKMRGSISVASDQGAGSVFIVKIPYEKIIEPKAESETRAQSKDGPVEVRAGDIRGEATNPNDKTIMLAEADDEVRNFIEYLLKRAGYNVTSAENADLALAFLNALPFDLVIVDVLMPESDEQMLFEKLQKDGFPNPMIALIEEQQSDEKNVAFIEQGFSACINKPIKLTDLLLTVKQVFVKSVNQKN